MHHHTSHHDPHQRSGPPIGLNDQYELGYAGEAGAIAWYEELGYQLLAHRARVKAGEIDAVLRAQDGTSCSLRSKRAAAQRSARRSRSHPASSPRCGAAPGSG